MFPEYTGNSIFLLPDFTMFRIWNTLPECIRNTCLFPECNWNTVSNFIILRNAPPKYTRNTLEIKKNIKKMTLTSAMNFVFFCNPSNASLGLLWLLLSRVSGEVDASSSRRTTTLPSVMGSISGYSERMWKDVKGCEENVKGCERNVKRHLGHKKCGAKADAYKSGSEIYGWLSELHGHWLAQACSGLKGEGRSET